MTGSWFGKDYIRQGAMIVVAGVTLLIDPLGALFEPKSRALIVSDLHLEKGSSHARRGQMVPPYDTAATLMRLNAAVARTRPALVIALGDSFHDNDGPNRMSEEDGARLAAMQSGRDWVWISGNHDSNLPEHIGGKRHAEFRLGPLTLRHEPSARAAEGEIAGHLHPVAVLGGRRRAFVTDGARVVAPAFGAYAGGLNLHNPAIAGLFSGRIVAHVLSKDNVYTVAASSCSTTA